MAAIVAELHLDFDEDLADTIIKGACTRVAEKLRALPRTAADDGSLWVDSKLLDEMAAKLTP